MFSAPCVEFAILNWSRLYSIHLLLNNGIFPQCTPYYSIVTSPPLNFTSTSKIATKKTLIFCFRALLNLIATLYVQASDGTAMKGHDELDPDTEKFIKVQHHFWLKSRVKKVLTGQICKKYGIILAEICVFKRRLTIPHNHLKSLGIKPSHIGVL